MAIITNLEMQAKQMLRNNSMILFVNRASGSASAGLPNPLIRRGVMKTISFKCVTLW